MIDLERVLPALIGSGVRFIVVGGAAAILHGSARLTLDLDIVYDRDPENVRRLVAALAPHSPYLRGAPAGLPFRLDERTVLAGLNFTLTTALGDLDLLGEVAGGGRYADLEARTVEVDLAGCRVRCVDLPTLIALKRAAGRPKDLDAIAELEALREEREGPAGSDPR